MNKSVIIVAGGTGLRMKTEIPKQFLVLAGKPILMHSISKFYAADSTIKIVVVLPFEHIATWNLLCSKHRFIVPHQIVSGGTERYYSVKNGLSVVDPEGLVAVHDGVRPLVSPSLILKGFRFAAEHKSAVPVVALTESLRKLDEISNHPVDRRQFCLVQTPQTFQTRLLLKAYENDFRPEFTDDAAVFEAAGNPVNLTEGIAENIKITTPLDLIIAETIFKHQNEQNFQV